MSQSEHQQRPLSIPGLRYCPQCGSDDLEATVNNKLSGNDVVTYYRVECGGCERDVGVTVRGRTNITWWVED